MAGLLQKAEKKCKYLSMWKSKNSEISLKNKEKKKFVWHVLFGNKLDLNALLKRYCFFQTFAVAIFYFIDWTRNRSTSNLLRVHRKTSCSERDPLLSTIISK